MYETQSYEDSMVLPPEIRGRWDFMETGSASAVLRSVCPIEGDGIKIVLKGLIQRFGCMRVAIVVECQKK